MRSARALGLDPSRIVCGAGSDDILNLLARAFLKDGDEAIHTRHGFLVYPIATLGAGAKPVAARDRLHRRRRRDPREGDAAAPGSCSSQSQQSRPEPYIPFDEVKRLHAGLPRQVLLGDRRGLCGIRERHDYETGIELVATVRERRDDPDVLKIYGLAGPAARLALRDRRTSVDALNRIRGPFNVGAPSIAAGVAAIATRRMWRMRASTTRNGWLDRGGDPQARTDRHAECRQLHPDPLPRDQGQDRAGCRRAAHLARRRDARGQAYHLPNALRMTIGTEEANRLTVATLAELMGKKG
jgi:histidinol-phosphate aminotransferase